MALRVGTAYVDVVPKVSGSFGSDVEKSITPGAQQAGSKAGGVLGSSMGKAALAVGGGVLAVKAKDFLAGSIAAARESAKIAAQTEAVVKSTGSAANVSVDHVGKLATSLSNMTGIDDEAIQSAENLLLTFTNVKNVAGEGNDVFDQSSKILVDMGAALGTDASSSAIQLGKALNDPIKGISALTRVGVTFSDKQKETIKRLVETGDVAGAQKVILGELNKEFGGSAAAQATSADKLKVAWGNLQESIGKKLIPVLDKVSSFLVEHQNLIGPLAAVIGGVLVVAFTAWAISAISAAAATIAAAAPVLAVIAVIGLLVAAVFLLVKNWGAIWQKIKDIAVAAWETIKGVFSAAWQWIQVAWDAFLGAIKGAWDAVWGAITGAASAVWGAITGAFSAGLAFVKRMWTDGWNALTGIVTGAFDAVKRVVSGAWDAITGGVQRGVDGVKRVVNTIKDALVGAFKHEFNGISRIWNSTVGKLSFHIPSWVPGIGGKGFDVPDIPYLAAGGGARARRPYVVGELGPELFVPSTSGTVLPNSALGSLAGSAGGFSVGQVVVNESDDPERSWQTANRELRAAAYLAGWAS